MMKRGGIKPKGPLAPLKSGLVTLTRGSAAIMQPAGRQTDSRPASRGISISQLGRSYPLQGNQIEQLLSQDGSKLSAYGKSSEDREMFAALVDYCYELQTNIRELEEREHHVTARRSWSVRSSERPLPKELVETSAESAPADPIEGSLSHAVEKIETKLAHIQRLFANADPLSERFSAAAKIQATVRRYLVRKRYLTCLRGIKAIRVIKCAGVIDSCMALIARLQNQANAARILQLKRFSKIIFRIFRAWKGVTAISAPKRREAMKIVEYKVGLKVRLIMHKVFEVLKYTCMAKVRRQRIIEDRKQLEDSIREQLSAQFRSRGEGGIVPLDVLDKALNARIFADFIAKKNHETKKAIMGFLSGMVVEARKNERKSQKFRFSRAVGKIFLAWSDWVYMVGVGLDRKRWTAARRYEVRYNQKKVDYFARRRLLRMTLFPWRRYTGRMVKAHTMFRNNVTRFIAKSFSAWRAVARRFRMLRLDAVDSWRGYSRLVMQAPFKMWAARAAVLHKATFEAEHRATLYCRWKQRKFLGKIMRTWRHFALYGRIDGMYSRPVLLQSLREQKMQSARMMKVMASQTVQIESMSGALENEIQRRKKLEKISKTAEEENRKGRMAAHHMQSEIVRLEAIIDAMIVINPNQINHLKQNQISFGFHDRNKAYGIDGTFDPYLTSAYVDDDTASESTLKSNTARNTDTSKTPSVTKVTVGTSTLDLYSEGNLADSISAKDKEQLERFQWLISHFLLPASEREDESNIYTAEEVPDNDVFIPPLSFEILCDSVANEYIIFIELVKNMLLFIKDGCTTGFSASDKRSWTKRLLRKANLRRPGSSRSRPSTARPVTASSHRSNLRQTSPVMESSEVDIAAVAVSALTGDDSDPLKVDATTWRTTLSALHAMSSTTMSNESTVYGRIVDMRENITQITNRHAGKFERRLARDEPGVETQDVSDEPNVYARNIKAQLEEDVNPHNNVNLDDDSLDDSVELD